MEKVSSARIALKWGLIYGIIGIVYNTIAYNTGLWKSWLIGLLAMLVLLFGTLYLAFNEYKILNAGFMTFKEGLGLGLLTITTGAILSVLFDNFYRQYIDPSLLEQQIEMFTEQYESMGLSETQIEEAVQKNGKFCWVGPYIFIRSFGCNIYRFHSFTHYVCHHEKRQTRIFLKKSLCLVSSKKKFPLFLTR